MVIIRLARGGAKKRPFYHVVVTNNRGKRDGRYIERLGFYNPVARGRDVRLRIDTARVEHWLNAGAQISDTVKNLVKRQRAQLAGQSQASAPAPAGGNEAPVAEQETPQASA